MMDQHAKVEKSIDRLECLGAQTSGLRVQAGFSAGMNLHALSAWSEGLGDYVRKLDCADVQGSAHFAGIGGGEPARCMDAAMQMQQAHQQQLHHAAGSVGDCVQFVQSVMEQCAAGVESIAVSAQGLCSAMRAMKPGPECEAIVQSLLTHAVQALMGLLTTRNDTLGQLCQQAVVDVQPASVQGDTELLCSMHLEASAALSSESCAASSTDVCPSSDASEGLEPPAEPEPAEQLQPESAPEPAGQQAEFDKTQHPSHPDSVAPAPEPPETPANPATDSPVSPPVGEGESSWAPDIWIEVQADSAVGSFGATDFEEPTTPAASLVGSSASVEINIERSEKW